MNQCRPPADAARLTKIIRRRRLVWLKTLCFLINCFMTLSVRPVKALWLLLMLLSASCLGQSLDKYDVKTFHVPVPYPSGTFRHTVWVNTYFLPTDWTNVAIGAPMFNYSARYYLPAGFGAEGNVSTLFVSSRFSAGPMWNYGTGKFHFGITYLIGYNLGILNDFGFSTTVTGWNQIPTFSFGYRFKRSSVTAKFGWEYFGNVTYKTGSNTTTFDQRYLNGWFTKLVLEQKMWKNHTAAFGVTFNRMNFIMLAWPAFPVNNKRYLIPEVSLGLTL